MRSFLIFVGFLLLLGGGAVAGLQYAPIDLSTYQVFDSIPGSREFLKTQNALYAGGGAAAFGLLLMVIAAATGAKRERVAIKPPSVAPAKTRPSKTKSQTAERSIEPVTPPVAPATVAPPPLKQPAPPPMTRPVPAPRPVTVPEAAPQPGAAAPAPQLAAASAAAEAPKAKPQASSQPPAGVTPDTAAPAAAVGPPPPDPRLINRKRVQDLVTINDALKAYYAKNGSYPKADGLGGENERGAAWIPGLSPDFLPNLPRDPLHNGPTQYVYVSDGANYKLLASGASLVGSGNVEVLGVKIDQTRNPTQQSASYGFWTPDFANA